MRDGLVEKEELEEILAEQSDSRQQRVSGRRLGEVLIQRGRVTPTQIAKLVAEQYELPFVDFDVADVDLRAASVMREDDARRLRAIPISRGGDGSFLVAIADPSTVLFSDELRRLLGSVPRFAVVGPDAIERAIAHVCAQLPPKISTAPGPSDGVDDLIVLPTDDAAPAEDTEVTRTRATAAGQSWPPLGALLLRDGLVSADDLEAALAQQRLAPSLRLGEILTGKGLVTRGAVARLVAEQYELPFYGLAKVAIDNAVARRLPEDVARRLTAVPIAESEDGSLQVAIADPTNAVYSDDLHEALGVPLIVVVASPDDIETTLDRVHEQVLEPVAAVVELAAEPLTESAVAPESLPEDLPEAAEHPYVEAAELPVEEDETWVTGPELVDEIPVDDDVPAEAAGELAQEQVLEPVAAVVELAAEPLTESAIAPESLPEDLPGAAEHPYVEAAELPVEEDETWVTGPELVDEIPVDDDVPAEAAGELAQEQAADVVSPVELAAPIPQEEISEPGPDEPDAEAAVDMAVGGEPEALEPEVLEPETLEPEVLEAEGYEFFWPAAPEHDEEPSLADDLVLQVAEAVGSDVLDAPVAYDIFGIASRQEGEPVVEPEDVEATADPVPVAVADDLALAEHMEDELVEEDLVEDEFVEDEAMEAEPALETAAGFATAAGFEAAVADALAAGASAFHFSPREDELVVRARIDGLLHDLGTATSDDRDALVESLVSEGKGRSHVVATSRGAKTILFVRERAGAPTSLDGLALDSDAGSRLRAALERPSGAILVCGPADSGTTTTLYALLDAVATPERAVATVEFPVERLLDGIDQIEASSSSGVTFAGAVRELRLTDTDAMLVGDLPDLETAVGALGAAYDGRLVLAGFHAPSAAAGVLRLADLGVEPPVLASSVGCVVSQRLVRTVCADCRETYYASDEELATLDQADAGSPRLLVRGAGCEKCGGTGFRGRTAIFEVMPMTDDVRELIADGASARKLRKAAVSAGMSPLADEAARLCLDGLTTVAEIARVLGDL